MKPEEDKRKTDLSDWVSALEALADKLERENRRIKERAAKISERSRP